MKVFKLLDQRIQELLREIGIEEPTEIQERGIPAILQGKNVLLIAPTGFGKTEAAILPIFSKFLEMKKVEKGIYILYITPLRALNRDMLRRTLLIGNKLNISISVRHGDTAQAERAKQVKEPPNMLITTPETLQILFTGRKLRNYLRTVRWVIIDEIHELAGEDRGAQLAVALERLEELTKPHSFQRIGLSATIGSPDEVARFLGGLENGKQRKVEVIEIDASKGMEIEVEIPEVRKPDREEASSLSLDSRVFASLRKCKKLIDEHEATLLFVNTRDTAEILGSRFMLWDKNFPIEVHHGSLSKVSRVEAEEKFKKKELKALICTSSLELGIDVGHADFVIQYSSPRQVTRLVQRVGRSGHKAGEISKGKIITLSEEDFLESIVIARRALSGELENLKIRENPLAVLANQIIAITLEYRRIDQRKVYEIIRRSYPFRELSLKDFYRVLDALVESKVIGINGEELRARVRSRLYFIDNISMIPDERNFAVIDITTRKKIGNLDESFVMANVYEGASFILQGRPWKIVKVEEKTVLVTPVKEIGKIPSWVGEDIPVPFEVAQEVGMLRKILREGKVVPYPCETKFLENIAKRMKKIKDCEVPSDRVITIEGGDGVVVINACFGTKVNETLGRIVSSLLAYRIGESVKVGSDPYRIVLEFSRNIPLSVVEETILSIDPSSIKQLLKKILQDSTFIRWYLVHVARKFGALSKDFDYTSIGVRRLFEMFESSIIFEETLEKVIWERMDVERASDVLKAIKEGNIRIVKQPLSPFSRTFEISRGLMLPSKPESVIIEAIGRRLEEKEIELICLNCFHRWKTTVGRTKLRPSCYKCGAYRIGVIKEHEFPDLARGSKTKEEVRKIKKLSTSASLVLSYGKFALLVLAGRGIGAVTAARILRKYRFYDLKTSEEKRKELLKDIWKAEIQYAETRGFWEK
mgnify:CR=1 FL=1